MRSEEPKKQGSFGETTRVNRFRTDSHMRNAGPLSFATLNPLLLMMAHAFLRWRLSTVSCTVPKDESAGSWWIPSWEPNSQGDRLKALLRGISLSEYGSEGFQVLSRRVSENGSVAYLVERPPQETQAQQYSDTTLLSRNNKRPSK